MKFVLSTAAIIAVIILIFPAQLHARNYNSFGPISVRNQNPVYLQNLGLTPRRAEPLANGTLETRIDSAYSNMYEAQSSKTSSMDFDMELWRLALNMDYGVRNDMEVGIEIPMLHFNGGFLDRFIQEFHNFFHLPNGGRENVPNGRFSYRFSSGGRDLLNYSDMGLGLGDISFHVKNQLLGEDDDWPDLSWFAEIKLPTGKKSRGLGSGAMDFGVGSILGVSHKRVHGHVNVGLYVLGGNQSISNFMYNNMFAFSLAGEVTLLPTWSMIVQLDGSTPLFNSTSMDDWDGVPMNLIVGFRGEERSVIRNSDLIWQFGFSEDITSMGPSVDFTVFFSIGMRFDILGRHRPAGDWLAKKVLK